MLQYKIPQNVEREDQILSFLTMKQLGILAAGGTVCYVLYLALAPTFFIEVWGPILFIPASITIAIAFVNVGGVSFSKWILLFLELTMTPRKRIWNNKSSLDVELKALVNAVPKNVEKKKKNKATHAIPEKKQKTMAELIAEIDGNKNHISVQDQLDLHPHDDEFIDDKEKKLHYQVGNLLNNQQRSGVIQMKKERGITEKGDNIDDILKENKKIINS